ncbi:MAG: AAA family ATPase [Candidatus Diapherotrites archaeon]|uniref:AAA family ATPase n=1 Tax=Candidatus Iainarchaeum sp. TaxID=3101447 RepID=A0A8T4L615_9ARCH|nr:AAA family ATPase [Candidatus Diapherotrites archaeon]
MFIGITGLNCSGKDTVAEILEDKGFVRRSLSDEIRKEMRIRNIPISDRDAIIKMGNDLRKTYGPGILAKRLLASVDPTKNYSFVSIRNPEEVRELKKHPQFFLVFLEADPKIRFERLLARDKIGSVGWGKTPKTFNEFQVEQEKELDNKDSAGQQLLKVREMSDIVIENNGGLDELRQKIDGFLDKLHFVYKRPAWDDYFIEMSRVVAKRATCDRGRSGCVIVRDKQILTTGYVGSPPGQPHCDEVGHLLKKVVYENGEIHQHCVRTLHAEQNALMQAAKLGISLSGATVYCKMTPCYTCAMLLISAGLKRVVCEKKYHGGADSEKLFLAAGVEYAVLHPELEKYQNQ